MSLDPLVHALGVVLEWQNILAMVIGVVGGIIVGAIPGLTASIGISLLLPLTYGMNPLIALGLMAGIHNGASYGGAIPAILLRIPGTPGAICTTFDGYPMTQQGLARPALRLAVISSAIGGMISAVALMLLAPPLALVALAFGPPEIFWVNVFGLASVSVLLGADPVKGLMASCFGLLLGCVGLDQVSGNERFAFDMLELVNGLPLLVILVGMYALPPAWQMAETASAKSIEIGDIGGRADIGSGFTRLELIIVWARSSLIGIMIGILPGLGSSAGNFIAYNDVKRTAKDPDSFGKGNPLGVACSECANNADNAASMIPALTLGVPGSGLAAIMLGALLIHGLQPGPQLFKEAPTVVYGYMWAMFFTSAMLIVFGGVFATRLFAQILRLPQVQLMPIIICLTVVGVFTFANNMFNVYLMFCFGLVGYALERLKFPIAPVVLGLILGPNAEFNLRTSMMLGRDDWTILFTRPVSQIVIALTVLVLFYPIITWLLEKHRHRA